VAMSAFMAPPESNPGATWRWQGSSNAAEGDAMAVIVGVACSLVALILAWRAYRGAAAEHEARKREKEERDGH
jgi:hypothetical protein